MIYGKSIWGTDWSLKKEYETFAKAKNVAKEMAKSSGVAHKAKQYPGKNIFQVWREIVPLNRYIPVNLKGKF
jgi:hypothetical protein